MAVFNLWIWAKELLSNQEVCKYLSFFDHQLKRKLFQGYIYSHIYIILSRFKKGQSWLWLYKQVLQFFFFTGQWITKYFQWFFKSFESKSSLHINKNDDKVIEPNIRFIQNNLQAKFFGKITFITLHKQTVQLSSNVSCDRANQPSFSFTISTNYFQPWV